MCTHNSIGVQECLGRRGVLEDINYPLCNRETESIYMPSMIVKKLNLFGYSWGLNGSSLKILLYKLVFLFAILLIWKNRNHVVFKGKSQNLVLAIEIKNQAMEYHLCASSYIDNPGLAR